MKLLRWKRFIWDLTKLPPREGEGMKALVVRPALKEEEKTVRETIFSAFFSDAAWGDVMKRCRPRLEAQIEAAFEQPTVPALVITHGSRIIAASLLAMEADAETHLLSGPCVLAEYRNRGIGSQLLYESLTTLRTAGLTRALGICKENVPTAKFVYRKFGSSSDTYDYEGSLVAS